MIVQHTHEGKAIARQNPDCREGRKPKYTKKPLEIALEMLEVYPYNQVVDSMGISKCTIIRAIKKKRAANELNRECYEREVIQIELHLVFLCSNKLE